MFKINYFKKLKKLTKRKRGFALVMTLVVLMALTTMSVAMMGVIRAQSVNSVRSHVNITVTHVAEYGIEAGKMWLLDELTKTGTDALIVRNSFNSSVSGDCLAMHGYTDTSENIYYAYKKNISDFASSVHTDFTRYKYEYYIQRIGYHTTINGYNYVPQSTVASDSIQAGTFTERRIFYKIISCGHGPDGSNQIATAQGYYSAGGDQVAAAEGQVSTNLAARELKTEGFYKP